MSWSTILGGSSGFGLLDFVAFSFSKSEDFYFWYTSSSTWLSLWSVIYGLLWPSLISWGVFALGEGFFFAVGIVLSVMFLMLSFTKFVRLSFGSSLGDLAFWAHQWYRILELSLWGLVNGPWMFCCRALAIIFFFWWTYWTWLNNEDWSAVSSLSAVC